MLSLRSSRPSLLVQSHLSASLTRRLYLSFRFFLISSSSDPSYACAIASVRTSTKSITPTFFRSCFVQDCVSPVLLLLIDVLTYHQTKNAPFNLTSTSIFPFSTSVFLCSLNTPPPDTFVSCEGNLNSPVVVFEDFWSVNVCFTVPPDELRTNPPRIESRDMKGKDLLKLRANSSFPVLPVQHTTWC